MEGEMIYFNVSEVLDDVIVPSLQTYESWWYQNQENNNDR